MTVREASAGDRERLRELYTDFVQEIPPLSRLPIDLEHELGELDDYLGDDHVALVAEQDGEVVAFALGKMDHPGIGKLSDLYVQPQARRNGIATELIRETARRLREEGAIALTLGVQVGNEVALATYERLGFQPDAYRLQASIDSLLERKQAPRGETIASIHVQLDDEPAVEHAVRKYVPRLGRSRASVIAPPRNGWIGVYDELCEQDAKAWRRLATELSNATGAVVAAFALEEGRVVRYVLLDRGALVDEYLSVPEYYGSLPPGDAIALGANPTVVARLTGADAGEVRRTALTAGSPEELRPAAELLASIAELFGIAGADRGFSGAAELPGAVTIDHG